MPNLTLHFIREKTTKNTVRFKEQPQEGKPPVIGYVYIQQSAAGQAREVTVQVTLEDKAVPRTKDKSARQRREGGEVEETSG